MSEPISSTKPDPKYFQPMDGPTPLLPKEKPKTSSMNLDAQPATAAPAKAPALATAAPAQSMDVKLWPTSLLESNVRALHARLAKESSAVSAADRDRLLTMESELSRRYAAEVQPSKPNGKVELCERIADLPANSVLGLTHQWLKTPNKEAGMGLPGAPPPGHKGGPKGYPGAPTVWNDHKGEVPTHCTTLEHVDVECVDREIQLGKSTGQWLPPFNDCHTVAADVVKKCATDSVDPYAMAHNADSDAGVP
jgi:hypothetical protein